MNKIYWSKIHDPESWDKVTSFYFPYAEKLAKTKYGWSIMKPYIAFRLWLRGL